MTSVTKIFSLLAILAAILWAAKFFAPKNNQPQIIINNQQIFVEVAATPAKIVQGLSGRQNLADNQGMLFVFKQAGQPVFWMKDMRFGLDFIFINGGVVVDLAENIPPPAGGPGEEPQIINAGQPFDQVLEINAGQIKKLGIKIGDKVDYSVLDRQKSQD